MLTEVLVSLLAGVFLVLALNKYPRVAGVVAFIISLLPFMAVLAWAGTMGITVPSYLKFFTLETSLTYNLGPGVIHLAITPLGWFFLMLLASVFPLTVMFANSFVKRNAGGFYAAMLLTMFGSFGLLLSQDILSFFIFWEIMSWSIFALVLRGHDRRAIVSYLAFGSLSAMLILFGFMMLYYKTNTFLFADMHLTATPLTLAALSLLVAGFAVKGALMPMHAWAPHAYSRSEEPFVAFLSGGLSKLGFFGIILFMYGVVGMSVISSWGTFRGVPWFGYALAVIGAFTAFAGTVLAVMQDDLRKLLAYSSIGQLGYIAIGIGIGTPLAMTGALFQALNHTFFKAVLFLAAGAVFYRTGKWKISELGGLGYKMPFTFLAALFAIFALAAIPITSGFAAKWLLYEAAIQKKFLFVTPIMLIAGVGAFLYAFKILYGVFLGEPRYDVKEAPLSQLIPMWLLVLPLVIFLVIPGWFVDITAPILRGYGMQPIQHTLFSINTGLATYNTLAVIFGMLGGLLVAFILYKWKKQEVVPHIDNYLAGEPPELYEHIGMHASSKYFEPFDEVFGPIFKKGAERGWEIVLSAAEILGTGARKIYTGIVGDYSIYVLLFFIILVGWWLLW
ncbi:MAG: NADH/ubiquinone/plastoquinone (complex I) [Euryarchaeota archaeon]|nr:NADH/ubiquinone/plastoquinone (complex I) [Euryarchaeota archaeon]